MIIQELESLRFFLQQTLHQSRRCGIYVRLFYARSRPGGAGGVIPAAMLHLRLSKNLL